jgi:hypothetical protein
VIRKLERTRDKVLRHLYVGKQASEGHPAQIARRAAESKKHVRQHFTYLLFDALPR